MKTKNTHEISICDNCLNKNWRADDCIIPLNTRYRKNYQLPDEEPDFGYTENKPLPYCYFYISKNED